MIRVTPELNNLRGAWEHVKLDVTGLIHTQQQ